jgi:cation:H+ antiporter
LSIGSDLPELVVTITASLQSLSGNDMSGIIVGSSIGSAFTQMGLVLGITGLMTYMVATKHDIYLVGSIVIVSILILILTGYDLVIDWADGLILLLIFSVYIVAVTLRNKSNEPVEEKVKIYKLKAWSLLLIALIIIAISADFVVSSAANLAVLIGMPQSLVAILIIGPGTSLPEFAISIHAIRNKHYGMSIGNILGSNIFDTLVPIGIAALISPVILERSFLIFDLPGLLLLSFITLFFLVKKKGLQKKEALTILSLYVTYLIIKLFVFKEVIA